MRTVRWEYTPSLLILAAVAGFWVAGALGLFGILRVSPGPMAAVIWMYLVLAAVAASIILAGGAVMDVTRRTQRHRRTRS